MDDSQLFRLQELEATLLAHPGVRQAAAVFRADGSAGKLNLVVYIVPDENYIIRVLADPENQQKRIHNRRKTFDLAQLGKQASTFEPGFNIAGWNSSYTRMPIPADQMREWVDVTVQEILSLQPREILEIGCGTGLLLLRIARGVIRYVGIDFAPMVLETLRQEMLEMGGDWNSVTLLERSAANFEGFGDDSFDTVILNSVLQYFPSATWLIKVLEEVCRVVKPGGRIFVGDVRNLALLDLYAASVELYRAPSNMMLAELRQRALRRTEFEEELVISPAFFLALQKRIPKISTIEVRPKRGRFDNELTRFRFNATLRLGTPSPKPAFVAWLDWVEQPLTLQAVGELLRDQRRETLAIKRITNARVEKDAQTLAALKNSDGKETVGDLRERLDKLKPRGIDPQKLWSVGEELGSRVDVSWTACRSDGSYDVVFQRMDAAGKSASQTIEWPAPESASDNLERYASVPGRAVERQRLADQLLDHCKSQLPNGLSPEALIVLDALPLTVEGKLDRQALLKADETCV
jgi:ubiquinone/menaquinone biosynthesis C-methylase UbiE